MGIDRADQGSDDRQFIHHSGHARKQFTNADARDFRGNLSELTADFRGRVRLDVEHVLMRGSTGQEDHDDGFMGILATGHGLGL